MVGQTTHRLWPARGKEVLVSRALAPSRRRHRTRRGRDDNSQQQLGPWDDVACRAGHDRCQGRIGQRNNVPSRVGSGDETSLGGKVHETQMLRGLIGNVSLKSSRSVQLERRIHQPERLSCVEGRERKREEKVSAWRRMSALLALRGLDFSALAPQNLGIELGCPSSSLSVISLHIKELPLHRLSLPLLLQSNSKSCSLLFNGPTPTNVFKYPLSPYSILHQHRQHVSPPEDEGSPVCACPLLPDHPDPLPHSSGKPAHAWGAFLLHADGELIAGPHRYEKPEVFAVIETDLPVVRDNDVLM